MLSTREAVRIELARAAVRGDGALDRAFVKALRLTSNALHVRRVGIWFAEDGFRRIRCRMLFDGQTERFTSGDTIDLTLCPTYAEALRSRRTIAADDARKDPRTAELGPYLEGAGIGSLLDTPIFQGGEVVGIVCHEHVGPPREFSKADGDFAASVADMIGLYLEQDDLQRTYRDLLAAKQELEQTRVMESLGRMAAGVAHDFNNVLAAISMKNDVLSKRSSDPAVASIATDVTELVEQGTRLVRQLVTFARREPAPPDVLDASAIIDQNRRSLEALAGRDVRVDFDLSGAPVPIRIDRGRFEQVVMNLVVNARDAMIGGGRMRVEVHREADRGIGLLRVVDTGVGMSEHTRSRMFEPFFSTKPEGTSSGLGLATVYGIVKDSNGSIVVDTQLGDGTAVTVQWPLARG